MIKLSLKDSPSNFKNLGNRYGFLRNDDNTNNLSLTPISVDLSEHLINRCENDTPIDLQMMSDNTSLTPVSEYKNGKHYYFI